MLHEGDRRPDQYGQSVEAEASLSNSRNIACEVASGLAACVPSVHKLSRNVSLFYSRRYGCW